MENLKFTKAELTTVLSAVRNAKLSVGVNFTGGVPTLSFLEGKIREYLTNTQGEWEKLQAQRFESFKVYLGSRISALTATIEKGAADLVSDSVKTVEWNLDSVAGAVAAREVYQETAKLVANGVTSEQLMDSLLDLVLGFDDHVAQTNNSNKNLYLRARHRAHVTLLKELRPKA